MRTDKQQFRFNHQISASEVRVIGADGKQLGVLSLSDAISRANKDGLDLIEIAPKAKPPVAKISDLGKFRYEQEKKFKKQKKGAKGSDLKEIRFSPFIGEHDYEVRMARINEFLTEGNKVRVTVVFKGRQLGSKNFGYELMDKVLQEEGDRVVVDMEPKFVGRHLQMVISPVKKAKVDSKKSPEPIKK